MIDIESGLRGSIARNDDEHGPVATGGAHQGTDMWNGGCIRMTILKLLWGRVSHEKALRGIVLGK